MKTELAIPIYELQNNTQDPVEFDLLLWGKKDQEYNFEAPHRHNFHEILIFQEGGGTHEIDFNSYQAKTYSVHFVANGTVHLILRNKQISSGCSLLFSNDYFSKTLTNKNFLQDLPFYSEHPVLDLSRNDFHTVEQLVNCIKSEYTNKLPNHQDIIRSYLHALMLHLHRVYKTQYPDGAGEKRKSTIITSFIELVEKYYKHHYSIDHYARHLNVTSKYLSEYCKREIGKTALQLIHNRTIMEAKRLLFHTQHSIKEIAVILQYDDPAYFTRFFKKETGCNPSEYREGVQR